MLSYGDISLRQSRTKRSTTPQQQSSQPKSTPIRIEGVPDFKKIERKDLDLIFAKIASKKASTS